MKRFWTKAFGLRVWGSGFMGFFATTELPGLGGINGVKGFRMWCSRGLVVEQRIQEVVRLGASDLSQRVSQL